MHIFIDESGTFSQSDISVVGALTIPDSILASITKKYHKLRSALPMENGEVKERKLRAGSRLGIVQRHHGTIEVTSAVGQGTTITVTLPVASWSPT